MSQQSGRLPIWQTPWFNTAGRFLTLAVVFTFFAVLVDDWNFVQLRNLESILRQSAVYATAALGMTLVIVAGGIDLSVGAVIAANVVAVAYILDIHWAETTDAGKHTVYLLQLWPHALPILAVVAGVAVATLAGLFNGVAIVGLRLVPFIVTLGTMGIFRGLAKGLAEERDLYPQTTWVKEIMAPTLSSVDPARNWMILPPGVWMMLVAAVAAALLLRYTRLGRHVYAVGSNEETARLCGVPVARTKIVVYTLAGFFAGLAGLMQFSYGGYIGQPTTAVGYELFVIAAVVIGGGSLSGGEGSILGSVIGALIITILYMGGQQMDWPKWVQEVVIGAIIIGSATLDRFRHGRRT